MSTGFWTTAFLARMHVILRLSVGLGPAAMAVVFIVVGAVESVAAAERSRLDKVLESGILRVCIWPDYYSITYRNPRNGQLEGIDIDLSQALAQDLGVLPRYVSSSFQTLIEDLRADRCDVAMFGVGITPQRQEHLRFTQPYLQSGIYGITTKTNPNIRSWEDIDQSHIVVAVHPGTFMETVMRVTLKRARLVAVTPPTTREQEVESGRADIFMTDYPFGLRTLGLQDWARLIVPDKPFGVTPYAYALWPGDDVWYRRLERFVSDIKADGRLLAAARRHNLEAILVLD